jgi:Cu/Ag efflux protein CusF
MRNLIVPTAVAAVVLTSSMAMAADHVSGKIKSFDLKADTITLDNGTVYTLPNGFKNPGLKDGKKVQITWSMMKGKHAASAVKMLN